MADKETRKLEHRTKPESVSFTEVTTSSVAPLHASLPRRDAAILHALQTLGVTAHHTATLDTLREFARAREAVGVLYDALGDFLNRPLVDYSGKSVADLVAEHGVRALEAVRSDVEYPVPAWAWGMRDVADAEIIEHCHPRANQLAWRYVAYRYLLQPEPEAKRPLSVLGSLRGGGRYNIGLNLPGLEPFGAVYTSLEVTTATQEMRFPTAPEIPYLLFPIRATLARVLDLRDEEVVRALELDEAKLYGPWREASKMLGRAAYPQRVGQRLFSARVEALLAHSVVDKGGTNLTQPKGRQPRERQRGRGRPEGGRCAAAWRRLGSVRKPSNNSS